MTPLYLLHHLLTVLNDKGVVTQYDLQDYDIAKAQKDSLDLIYANIGVNTEHKHD